MLYYNFITKKGANMIVKGIPYINIGYSKTKCLNCNETVKITSFITQKSSKSFSIIEEGCNCGSFSKTILKEESES